MKEEMERSMYSEVGFAQYMRLLELERKADMDAGIIRSILAAKELKERLKKIDSSINARTIRDRLAAIHKRIAEREEEDERERRYGKDKGR